MGLNEKFFKSAAAAGGSDYFNTVLYTGNGYPNSGTQPITEVGFKPDLVFIKARDTTAYPVMVDSIRGNLKYLYPNTTLAQATQNGTGFLSFDDDGFSLGADTAGDGVNRTNDGPYVSWNFKAGGPAVAGTGTNAQSVSYSANPDAGFSIVKFTANGSSTYTATHGLNQAPDLVITKSTTASANWISYVSSLGISKYIYFNTTAAEGTYSNLWSGMSSTHIGGTSAVYGASHTFIHYCFHSVAGVQKIGSYTGSGISGKQVTGLGFKPSFVMIKGASAMITARQPYASWTIHDNKREIESTDNVTNPLFANKNYSEGKRGNGNTQDAVLDLEFEDNGFKINHNGPESNSSSDSYIYLAIA